MYHEYDTIILTDGRVAAIVDIPGPDCYIVDVGSSPADWDTITVTGQEIAGLADGLAGDST